MENKKIKSVPNSCHKLYWHVQLCYVWPKVCETEDNMNGKKSECENKPFFFFFSATRLKLYLPTNYLEKKES